MAVGETERWATFDCYGTLIDWNGGIGRQLERLFGDGRRRPAPACVPPARAGRPARAADALLPRRPQRHAGPARRAGAVAAARRGVGRARALAALVAAVPRGARRARGRPRPRLEARDPLQHRPRLRRGVAQPDRRLLRARDRRVRARLVQARARPTGTRSSSAPAQRASGHVHVGASLFHDIAPATSLGLRTVWVNRLGERPEPAARRASCTRSTGSPTRWTASCREAPPRDRGRLPRDRRLPAEDEERLLGRRSRLSIADVQAWLHRTDLETGSWLFGESGRIVAFGWAEPHGEVGVAIGIVRRGGEGSRPRLASSSGGPERASATRRASRIHEIALAADERAPRALRLAGLSRGAPLLGDGDRPRRSRRRRRSCPTGCGSRRSSRARRGRSTTRSTRRSTITGSTTRVRSRSGGTRSAPRPTTTRRSGSSSATGTRSQPSCATTRTAAAAAGSARSASAVPGAASVSARRCCSTAFGEFHARGTTRVGLGVDAENPTGATTLYEGVGMRIDMEQVVYEKSLG